jgi:integrase
VPNITDLFLKGAKEGMYWDGGLPGFGVRIGKKRKTFLVLIASGRRKSIGHYPLLSLAEARKTARGMLAEKVLGKVHPTHMAFDDAKEDYLEECAVKLRPITIKDYTNILNKHYPFGRKSVGDITPHQILKRLKLLDSKPTRKRYAFAVGRAFFNWCVQQQIIQASPMTSLVPPEVPKPRDRVLTLEELTTIYTEVMHFDSPFYRIVTLLILTGARRGELAHLQWDWITEDDITFPWTVTKNKREHIIPVTQWMENVFEMCPRIEGCQYVFPAARTMSDKTTVFNGWGKPKAALDKKTGVTDWTLHDLRRTVATFMAGMGVEQVVVEKILNHVSGGTQSPIAQVYNRHKYHDEMASALSIWHHYLDTMSEPRH